MPGPQDPLTQILLNRASLGQVPDQAPDTSVPQGPSDMSPAYTGEVPPNFVDNGVNFLLSAAGLRGQKPGDVATGLGSAAGIIGPHLASLPPALGVVDDIPPFLRKVFADNPAAKPAYERAMAAQAQQIKPTAATDPIKASYDKYLTSVAPEVTANKQAMDTANYSRNADAHDALMDIAISDRPRIVPTDTGFSFPIPKDQPQAPSGPVAANSSVNGLPQRLAASGLTEDDVRMIRFLGTDSAAKRYPHLNRNTIRMIANGDSFSQIK